MTTAVMDRDVIAAAFAAALERKKAGRRQEFRSYSRAEQLRAELDGVTLERIPVDAPEFREARTAAEFWDDQLLRFAGPMSRGTPELRLVAVIAAAARDGGADAAVKAVRQARDLSPAKQYAAWENLRSLGAAKFPEAERTVNAVLAEWRRLKLATADPALRVYRA